MVIGSFLNVCITRIPENVSIILPGSRCPKCGTAIRLYDNVPVFAWIWLGGKCRACGAPISVMYPLVELATGLLFVAAFLEYGITQAGVKWLFFTCLIVVLTITDLRVRLLPDLVTWPGFAVGLMFSWVVPPREGFAGALGWRFFHRHLQGHLAGLLDGILGAAFGSFLLWGLAAGYKLVRKREGMGIGGTRKPKRAGSGEYAAVDHCQPIPAAARDVFGNWRAGNCLPWSPGHLAMAGDGRHLRMRFARVSSFCDEGLQSS